jgi:aarF domain-containing kinase
MDWMEAVDPLVQLPADYVLMARVSVLLRGLASAFGLRFRTAPSWAGVAEEMLRREDPERLARWQARLQQPSMQAAKAYTGR